jgi:DNA polymerase
MPESGDWSDVVELCDWILDGGLVEAHNVWFEFCIWNHILVPQYEFPPVAHGQWRCSAAKAAAHALPRGLEDAIAALDLDVEKDLEGQKVMKKITKPRKSRKKEREGAEKTGIPLPPYLWWETRDLFERLWEYCRQDVLAEEALSAALDDLSPLETDMFAMDQAINARGFQLDQTAVDAALRLIAAEERTLNRELTRLTGGVVKKATQRAQMIEWFKSEGLHLFDTQAATLDALLAPECQEPITPVARRALEIIRSLGLSSTAKYQKMADWAGEDWRIRGGLLYHGASTGRWSGAGVQPHNFVRGNVKDMEGLWKILICGTRQTIGTFPDAKGKPIGSVMRALSNALRGAICASTNKALFIADYASIEARVLLWIADDQAGLDIFRRHEDIYCEMATSIFKRPITKADNERQVGKQAILGLGYKMGAPKFQTTCAKVGITIDDDLAKSVVDAYRLKFWRVKQLWADMEACAVNAVMRPGRTFASGKIRWKVEGRFLYCTLPSGRRLAYPDPQLRPRPTPWGETRMTLTYKGINTYTRQWQRQPSYGGMLVENIVQAVSRDLMAEAMLRIEATSRYQVVLTVHDEIIAESAQGNIKEFETLMAKCPEWATGCPVEVEGWTGPRYKK